MKFTELDLQASLLESIQQVGYADCTPIQELVIPQVLRGKDVSGLAQTGTGKTAAFVIPLIDRILRFRAGETGERVPANWKKNSYVLVLVPTRELAVQVAESIALFGKATEMKSVVVVGGGAYDEQRGALRSGVEFVVGTPGRLLDLYKSHDLDLNGVGAIVFDEADRMFDMGFKDDMKFILRRVPRERQFLLFSATLNFDVLNTAYQFGAEPVEFNVSRDQITAEGIDHEVLHVGQFEKPMFLLSIIKKFDPQQGIVFSNFKHMVKPIARFLKDNGYEAIEMSSLLSQQQRNKVLESFKSGKAKILVATDVAARGLDVKGVDLVVNFDLPDDPEGYVHRIGRTGRAGTNGRAIGLVSDRDVEALQRVEEYLKEKLKIGWMENTELLREFKPINMSDDRGGENKPHAGRPKGPPRPSGRGPSQGHSRPPREGGGQGSRGPARPPRPQGQNTRPPQQNPQGERPPATPRTEGVHGQISQGTPNAVASQHRDRKLGRHGGVMGSATGGAPRPPRKEGQHQGSGNRGGNRPSNNRGTSRNHDPKRSAQGGAPQRRPLNHDKNKSTSAQPSVGQKIKSFFTKIFK